jgi:hypothetical protein
MQASLQETSSGMLHTACFDSCTYLGGAHELCHIVVVFSVNDCDSAYHEEQQRFKRSGVSNCAGTLEARMSSVKL